MKTLKEIRKSVGFSQSELAKKIKITQQQYSRYEVGINKIPLDMFLKIIEACHYKIKLEKIENAYHKK